jgi:predicted amidohydrolase
MVMESEELLELMRQIEEKGIGWDKVEEQTKISHDLLKLYVNSGPVPVTIINGLKKVLEEPPQ